MAESGEPKSWQTHSIHKEIQKFLNDSSVPQNDDMVFITKQLKDMDNLLEEYHERVNYLKEPKEALIFSGIPENQGEFTMEVIMDFVQKFLQVKVIPPTAIKCCFRFGNSFPRDIAVLFKHQGSLREIWSRKPIFAYSRFFMEKIDTSEFERSSEEPQSSSFGYWENSGSANKHGKSPDRSQSSSFGYWENPGSANKHEKSTDRTQFSSFGYLKNPRSANKHEKSSDKSMSASFGYWVNTGFANKPAESIDRSQSSSFGYCLNSDSANNPEKSSEGSQSTSFGYLDNTGSANKPEKSAAGSQSSLFGYWENPSTSGNKQ